MSPSKTLFTLLCGDKAVSSTTDSNNNNNNNKLSTQESWKGKSRKLLQFSGKLNFRSTTAIPAPAPIINFPKFFQTQFTSLELGYTDAPSVLAFHWAQPVFPIWKWDCVLLSRILIFRRVHLRDYVKVAPWGFNCPLLPVSEIDLPVAFPKPQSPKCVRFVIFSRVFSIPVNSSTTPKQKQNKVTKMVHEDVGENLKRTEFH